MNEEKIKSMLELDKKMEELRQQRKELEFEIAVDRIGKIFWVEKFDYFYVTSVERDSISIRMIGVGICMNKTLDVLSIVPMTVRATHEIREVKAETAAKIKRQVERMVGGILKGEF